MKITVGLCLFGLVCSTGVYAQSVAGSGAVTGIVRDQYNDGLPETKVVLSNPALGIHRSVVTTDDGVFDVPMLPPSGSYKLQVSRTGFATWDSTEFDVSIGQTVYFEIDMKVEEPATQVEASRALAPVDNSRVGISTLITRTQLDNLPFNMRRLDAPVLLAPALTSDPGTGVLVFRGGPFVNGFFTDGLLTTNRFNPNQPGIADQVAPDAVAEMQVIVAGPSAEFSDAAGGMINTAIRTGGNSFHGDAYGYYSSNDWSSVDRFALGHKLFQKQTEAGASVGGPVWHDKIFFFLNADVLHGTFDDLNRITSPLLADSTGTTIATANCGKATAAACTQAIAMFTPQMNVLSALSQRWNSGVARFDYRRSDRDTFGVEGNAMNARLPVGPNIQAVAPNGGLLGINDSTVDTRYAKASWLHGIFNGGVNELRAGWMQDRYTDPISTENLANGNTAITVAGATIGATHPDASQFVEKRYQGVDNFNWTTYSHSIKLGASYVINRDAIVDLPNPAGSYTYPLLSALATDLVGNNQRNYTIYNQTLGISSRSVQQKTIHAYAQDNWKVTRDLTVTGGVNWEKTKFQQPDGANATYYQTQVIPARTLDFAPRVGIALQTDNRTVVRLGFGWYFSPYPGDLMDALKLGNSLDQYSISTVAYQSNAPVFPKSVASVTTIPNGFENVLYTASKFRNPYTQQATLAIEHRLSRDTALTLNLIDSRGYKLWTASDQNLFSVTTAETYTIDNAAGQNVGSYAAQIFTTGLSATNTSSTSSLHTSDPNHEHVYQVDNTGSSWYYAGALQVRKQMGRDLSAQLSYTYSHAQDNVGGPQVVPGVPISYGPNDYGSDKGNSPSNQRQRGVLNFVWTPTVFKNPSPAERLLANGWQISGIATIASAQAVTPLVIVSGQQFTGVAMEYLNSLNGSGGWGRVPFQSVNSLKLGDMYNVNARAAKTLAFTEHIRATFAFEAYNVLNRQYTTGVNNVAYIATLGVLKPVSGLGEPNASSAYPYGSTARRAQVSVRIEF
jgi:hypothetical protein